jgi:hypothetical protein
MATADHSDGPMLDPALGGATEHEFTFVVLGSDDSEPLGFQLGASRLSVGAGENDDVFLTGVGVVPSHVQLIFLEGRVTLLSAAEEVRVDGQAVTAFPFDLKPLQPISLSPDTHLAYGAVGSTWPRAPTWVLPEQAPEADADADASAVAATGVAAAGQAPVPHTARTRAVHSARLGAVALAAATVIVTGLVVTDLIWGDREVVNPAEVSTDRSEEVLDRLLASDPKSYGSVRLTVRPDGALALTGFLDSEAAFRKLAEQVRQEDVNSSGNVRLDAMTSERLSALVKDHLARFPLGSRLEVTPSLVHVTIFGVLTEQEGVDRIRGDLMRLATRVAPRKLEIEFRVQPAEQIVSEVTSALGRVPVTRELQFRIDDEGGRITGLVAAAVESEARAAVAEVQKTFADRLPLTVDLKVDPKLNFSLLSLTQGGDGSSATLSQRGKTQTFRVGEPVFGVGELLDIKVDGVVLALGRREVFLPLIR